MHCLELFAAEESPRKDLPMLKYFEMKKKIPGNEIMPSYPHKAYPLNCSVLLIKLKCDPPVRFFTFIKKIPSSHWTYLEQEKLSQEDTPTDLYLMARNGACYGSKHWKEIGNATSRAVSVRQIRMQVRRATLAKNCLRIHDKKYIDVRCCSQWRRITW